MSKIVSIILLFIFSLISYSQNSNYKFKTLHRVNGLSQSSVIAVEQDRFGQMWFATRKGLNKYDGNKFTVYKNEIKDTTSILHNDILSIEEDKKGFLWIGTYKGLCRYNPSKDNFQRYFKALPESKNKTIRTIKEIDNEIWFGSVKGVFVFDKVAQHFENIELKNFKNEKLDLSVYKIFRSSDNIIWLGTSQGLFKVKKRSGHTLLLDASVFDFLDIPENKLQVQDIIERNNKQIVIATKRQGILVVDSKTNKGDSFYKQFGNLANKDCRALAVDKLGDLWVGTSTSLYKVFKNNRLEVVDDDEGLTKIKSMFIDKKGSLWVGTYYNGIKFWDESNLNFTNLQSIGINDDLKFTSALEIDGKKNIYIGTDGGKGILVVDSLLNKIGSINSKTCKGLLSNNIKSLLVINNYLFIGTFSKGVYAYNLNTKQLNTKYFPSKLIDYISNTSIYKILQTGSNTLLIGTFGKGVIRFNTLNKSFTVIDKDVSNANSFTNNKVRTCIKDSKGRVWVATVNGLNLICPNQTKINHYFFDDNESSITDILTVFEDSSHHIWVGTKYRGLFKFNGDSFDKVEIIDKEKGIKVETIHAIQQDQEGKLWMSTNSGIISYNMNEVVSYNYTDDIQVSEFNNNASLNLNSKYLFFGGVSGLLYFNPKQIQKNIYAPQVIITDFKINNKAIPVNKTSILKKNILFTDVIELPHDKANFTLNFSIPNFINPKNNMYSYRLVGVQNDWITTNKTDVLYTLQNSGNYTFEVKGANNYGVWNNSPTQLKIKVLPAPWRSWWAYLIYCIIILSAFWVLLFLLKSNTKLEHKLQLEHMENQRIEELNKTKLEFFTNISHEFKTPLTLILGPIQKIISEFNGDYEIYKKLTLIENNGKQLLHLINRLINFRKLQNKQSELYCTESDIVQFLNEVYNSFTEYANNGKYNFTINSNKKKIVANYDKKELGRVFYNLISNAFKYTPKGGDVNINILKKNEKVIVEIEDSGIGIPKEYLERIFDRFFEVPNQIVKEQSYVKGTGIGLSIAKNIIALHNGKIKAKNRKKGGAVFKVVLPILNSDTVNAANVSNYDPSKESSVYLSQLESLNINNSDYLEDDLIDDTRPTILVVEDNNSLRAFIKSLLDKVYNVLQAENGETGLKKAIQFTPDLIISDVVMPIMTGDELCSKIKNNLNTSHIPFILLTSKSSQVHRLKGLESGADAYINKPFDIDEFGIRIKNILQFKKRLIDKFGNDDDFSPEEVTVSSLDEQLLKKAFKIVEENISNDEFDIATFCRELGVSRTILFTKIKAWTKMTPNEFIQVIRMKRAAKLLESNKMNISQVCYEVGFKNPKYFSRCFQKKYGFTPRQYKKNFFKTS